MKTNDFIYGLIFLLFLPFSLLLHFPLSLHFSQSRSLPLMLMLPVSLSKEKIFVKTCWAHFPVKLRNNIKI